MVTSWNSAYQFSRRKDIHADDTLILIKLVDLFVILFELDFGDETFILLYHKCMCCSFSLFSTYFFISKYDISLNVKHLLRPLCILLWKNFIISHMLLQGWSFYSYNDCTAGNHQAEAQRNWNNWGNLSYKTVWPLLRWCLCYLNQKSVSLSFINVSRIDGYAISFL